MSTINLRVGNDALTFEELDANFTNLNNDKYESGADADFRTVTFTNLEKSNIAATDGELGFDSSQGLIIRRTQQNVTSAVVSILDGANVNAGTSINISNLGSGTSGGGTGTEQFTFSHADVTRTDPSAGSNSLTHSGSFSAITSVTTNAQGHITAVQANTFTLPAGAVPNDGLLDINEGTEISLTITGGDFTADKSTETDIIINHANVTRSDPAAGSSTLAHDGTFSAITGVTTNDRGHVTAVQANTFTLPSGAVPNNATITLTAGNGLTTGGDFTTDQASDETITFTMGTPGSLTQSTTNAVTATSHTHAVSYSFDALTSKTSGTGEYSTSSNLVSGRGSGGVALTINDGKGNANVTWNHKSGVPEQDGNAARLEVNTDSSTSATMYVELKSGVTGGASIDLQPVARFSESYVQAESTTQGVSFLGSYHEDLTSSTGGSYAVDCNYGVHWRTVNAACTISFTNPPASNTTTTITLVIQQDATGNRTITWPTTNFYWAENAQPPQSTDPNDIDVYTIQIISKAGTLYYIASLSVRNAS